MEMKKIIIGVIMLITGTVAHATTMCATDDTMAIVLDPAINGTSNTYNSEIFEWSTVFSYGTLWGIATCVDTKGTYGVAVDELRDSNGELAKGGERTGVNCWCQMTHPAVSRWVFHYANSSVADCRTYCANYCGDYVRNYSAFRAGVFGSLGI